MTRLKQTVHRVARVREVPHGVSDELVITLYPGGTIGIRELRRALHSEQRFDAGELYSRAVIRQALAVKRAKRKARCRR